LSLKRASNVHCQSSKAAVESGSDPENKGNVGTTLITVGVMLVVPVVLLSLAIATVGTACDTVTVVVVVAVVAAAG
jgi:hypothetical protein